MLGDTVMNTQMGMQASGAYGQLGGQQTQSLFTAEQVNGIVQGRVNSLNQKIIELQNQAQKAQADANQYMAELTSYRNKATLSAAGVPDYMQDYVAFEVNKSAVNGKTFDQALAEFKVANPNMFTSPNVTNSATQTMQTGQVVSPQGAVVPMGVGGQSQQAVQTVGAVVTTGGVAPISNAPVVPMGSVQTSQMPTNPGQVSHPVGGAVVAPDGTATMGVGQAQPQPAIIGNTTLGGAVGAAVAGFDVNAFIKGKTKMNI